MIGTTPMLTRIVQTSLFLTILAATPAAAEPGFAHVAGSWSGNGTMQPKDGPRERVRCKAEYVAKNADQSVKLNLRCASDAYKMEMVANLDQDGTAISGNWFESVYRQGGKITGQNVNDVIEARAESNTVVALLTVRTKGSHQSFVLEAPGAWVAKVAIEFAKDGAH